jgi:RNA polymerase sigma factor (sigma-70 family)
VSHTSDTPELVRKVSAEHPRPVARCIPEQTAVSRPTDEAELVERARRGDDAAFDELVRLYQGVALRTAYVISGNSSDAEEAAQTAFVKAYFALRRFRRGAPFRPWLLRIVANEASNQRRATRRRAALAVRVSEQSRAEEVAPSPELPLLSGLRAHRLAQAISALPVGERDVVACRYLLGLSEEETAKVLRVAVATVRSRRVRALRRLREILGDPHE